MKICFDSLRRTGHLEPEVNPGGFILFLFVCSISAQGLRCARGRASVARPPKIPPRCLHRSSSHRSCSHRRSSHHRWCEQRRCEQRRCEQRRCEQRRYEQRLCEQRRCEQRRCESSVGGCARVRGREHAHVQAEEVHPRR